MTFEEVIREYIGPQCGNDIDVSCKVFVVKSEDDRARVEASAKERGLAEGEYTIIVSPELIEKIQNGEIKTTHQGTTSCRYPYPKVLKRAPNIGMIDCTGYAKQQQREAKQYMKEQNKLRNRYFNKNQRFKK